MFQGELVGIYMASVSASAMQAASQATAVAGRGLEGDRYYLGTGTFTRPGSADREITLIELEAIEAARHDYQLDISPVDARRNLLTHGVPLNHLVGKSFAVGEVTLRGLRLCEPCGHLEKLTCKGIKRALQHRGGLRAQIVIGGTIQLGDLIRPLE